MKNVLSVSGKFGRFLALILVVAIVAAAVVLGPRLLHSCDNCGSFFVGTGYYTNIISSTISDWTGGEDKIICADCAATEHALAIAAGQSIKDFQRPLFEQTEGE